MADYSSEQFDFDDWAGLYLEDPQEFEARRSAALMIELMRGNEEQRAAGKQLLEAYEKQVKGCSPQERMQVASRMMADSVSQLGTELKVLKHTLEGIESDVVKQS